MPDYLPSLCDIEQSTDVTWAVTHEPDDVALCHVPPRRGEPPHDAKRRARKIAMIMNATADISIEDICDLFDAYEAQHGHQHRGDWRGQCEQCGATERTVDGLCRDCHHRNDRESIKPEYRPSDK